MARLIQVHDEPGGGVGSQKGGVDTDAPDDGTEVVAVVAVLAGPCRGCARLCVHPTLDLGSRCVGCYPSPRVGRPSQQNEAVRAHDEEGDEEWTHQIGQRGSDHPGHSPGDHERDPARLRSDRPPAVGVGSATVIDPQSSAAVATFPGESRLVIDEAELGRLERELADAADTLEAVEKICAAGTGGADTAVAIRQLLDDGRFISAPES